MLLLMVSPASANQNDRTVYLYTYHNKPPFVVDEQRREGLYFDMAAYFTLLVPDVSFRTIYLPRKRLNLMIENQTLDGAVIGVSPVWFGDKDETRFLWLPTIYPDRDEFVSLSSDPFEFTGTDSLHGKVFAGVSGYYYFGVNQAVADKHLMRIDTIGERQVLELIERQRADIGIVSQSVFAYLRSTGELSDIYHFSARPHDEFNRRAFTLKKHRDIYEMMQALTENLLDDPVWQKMVQKYQ